MEEQNMRKLYKMVLVLCMIGLLVMSLDSALGEDPASYRPPDITGTAKPTDNPKMYQNDTNIPNETMNGTNETDVNVSTSPTEAPIETTVEDTITEPVETTAEPTIPESTPKETPGFGLIIAMVVVYMISMLRRK